jgi:hypothetical protein
MHAYVSPFVQSESTDLKTRELVVLKHELPSDPPHTSALKPASCRTVAVKLAHLRHEHGLVNGLASSVKPLTDSCLIVAHLRGLWRTRVVVTIVPIGMIREGSFYGFTSDSVSTIRIHGGVHSCGVLRNVKHVQNKIGQISAVWFLSRAHGSKRNRT